MPNSLHSNKYVIIAFKQGQWSYFYRKREKNGFFSILIREDFVSLHSHPPHAVAVDLPRDTER